jgi:hypothetical protein
VNQITVRISGKAWFSIPADGSPTITAKVRRELRYSRIATHRQKALTPASPRLPQTPARCELEWYPPLNLHNDNGSDSGVKANSPEVPMSHNQSIGRIIDQRRLYNDTELETHSFDMPMENNQSIATTTDERHMHGHLHYGTSFQINSFSMPLNNMTFGTAINGLVRHILLPLGADSERMHD